MRGPRRLAIAILILVVACAVLSDATARRDGPASSAAWLGLLPDGVEKRKFVLDCTGCHQFNETRVFANGAPRTRERWQSDVARMLRYAGAASGFPVIAADRDSAATAAWLSTHLASARHTTGGGRAAPDPSITEIDLPAEQDLPHDAAVDAAGHVLITGMFTDRIYILDPATDSITTVAIPIEHANPRAIEIDRAGNWWVLLGAPKRLARYEPGPARWTTWEIGMYGHSIAVEPNGRRVWFNGHFTRDPELVGCLDLDRDTLLTFAAPRHPTLAARGGPVPYELRLAPDGTLWMSELQGNRMVALDPRTGRFEPYDLPTSWSGPRRFDVDRAGVLWIPAYAANRLVRFDPRTKKFREYPLPIRDAVPYVGRVHPQTGDVWIGTAAADAVLRFDPRRERFTVHAVPTRGATMRHLAFDPRSGDAWIAYGASPAIHPPRVARVPAVAR